MSTTPEMAQYAKEAGLRETDMPSDHHPLLENDDDIRELSDLIDARENQSHDLFNTREAERNDQQIDIEDALTFPHKTGKSTPSSVDLLPDTTDFDADARTHSEPDDEDDMSYMTRADFVDSMEETDPDPNTGMSSDELLEGAGLDRAPNMTGTVQGIGRGFSTHLPLDLGADGFQIMDPENSSDPRAEADPLEDEESETEAWLNEDDGDAGVIPTAPVNINNSDEALDATRRLS
jgi:hypothetical protein